MEGMMEGIVDVREPALTMQEAALLTTGLNSTGGSCRAARLQTTRDDSHFVPVRSTCARQGTCTGCCRRRSSAGSAVLRARGICMPGHLMTSVHDR